MKLVKTINIEQLKALGVIDEGAKEIMSQADALNSKSRISNQIKQVINKIKRQKFDYGVFLINDKYIGPDLERGTKFCSIPLCCPINRYEEYLDEMYNLGAYNREVSFYNGFKVVKDVATKSEPIRMVTTSCSLLELSSQNIRVAMDVKEDAVIQLIRECSALVGFDKVKEILNNMNISDLMLNEQVSVVRNDIRVNSFKTIVY